MFIGHYAAAYALKAQESKASLGLLFIGVQFVDILFFPLALAGIESLTFVENFTAVNNLVMNYYPFTHGMLAAVVWATLFYFLFKSISKGPDKTKRSIALVMAMAVMSHWVFDLFMHTPDLPLITGQPKLGFGLWNYKLLSFALEIGLLAAGWYFYHSTTENKPGNNKHFSLGLLLFLVLVQSLNYFVLPLSTDILELTISALFAFLLLAYLAHLVDKRRSRILEDWEEN